MVVGLALLIGLAVAVSGYAMVGHLSRIADAIEAQNRAYGIGAAPAEESEAA